MQYWIYAGLLNISVPEQILHTNRKKQNILSCVIIIIILLPPHSILILILTSILTPTYSLCPTLLSSPLPSPPILILILNTTLTTPILLPSSSTQIWISTWQNIPEAWITTTLRWDSCSNVLLNQHPELKTRSWPVSLDSNNHLKHEVWMVNTFIYNFQKTNIWLCLHCVYITKMLSDPSKLVPERLKDAQTWKVVYHEQIIKNIYQFMWAISHLPSMFSALPSAVPVPATERVGLLPSEEDPAPRPQTSELTYQWNRGT